MQRRTLAAAAAIAAALLLPAAADAATIHPDSRTPHALFIEAAPDETNLISIDGRRNLVIRDIGAPLVIDGVPTCTRIDVDAVSCAAVRKLELELGTGPDVAVIGSPVQMLVEGGTGADRYVALGGVWPSNVEFRGGSGVDVANYGFATAGVRVSLDLLGGDGRAGDDDRIRRDVETVIGSAFPDVLTGAAAAEQLLGLDGDDTLTGGAGQDTLSGGPGNDAIDARDGEADTVDCGGQLADRATTDAGAEQLVTGCAEVF